MYTVTMSFMGTSGQIPFAKISKPGQIPILFLPIIMIKVITLITITVGKIDNY